MENLPVIQGSFEVTKTDADITQRRLNMSSSPTIVSTSTLRPIVVSSAAAVKVKETIKHHTAFIEKVTTKMPFIKENLKTNKNDILKARIEIAIPTTTTSSPPSASLSQTTTTTMATTMTTTTTTIASPTISNENVEKQTEGSIIENPNVKIAMSANEQNPPKLDVNLFTSTPILDKEPWRPISAVVPKINKPVLTVEPAKVRTTTNPLNVPNVDPKDAFIKEADLIKSNQKFSEPFDDVFTEDPNHPLFYKSFTNPGFSTASQGIERLGTANVRPYPIPVNKLLLAAINDRTVLGSSSSSSSEELSKDDQTNLDKFEYLGDGVFVKKQEITTEVPTTTENTPMNVTDQLVADKDVLTIVYDTDNENLMKPSLKPLNATLVGDLIRNLLDIGSEIINSTTESNTDSSVSTNFPPNDLDTLEFRNIGSDIEAETDSEMTDEWVTFSSVSDSIKSDEYAETTTSPSTTTNSNIPIEINVSEISNIRDIVKDQHLNQSTINVSAETVKGESNTKLFDELRKGLLEIESFMRNYSTNKFPTTTEKSIKTTTVLLTTEEPATTTTSVNMEIESTPNRSEDATDSISTKPSLFPMDSKWEFVNGTLITPFMDTGIQKVFNKTLQAVIVENNQMNDKPIDINFEKQNKENIQNLSSIFDTLSTKLGITPNIPNKVPPFSTLSQNKLRGNKPVTFKSPPSIPILLTSDEDSAVDSSSEAIPILLNSSPESVVGEAEIEEIDPIKFEEFLKLQQQGMLGSLSTTTMKPSLVTLLPVKSNSGIRTFRPPRPAAGETNNLRGFKIPVEAIVKTTVNVNS